MRWTRVPPGQGISGSGGNAPRTQARASSEPVGWRWATRSPASGRGVQRGEEPPLEGADDAVEDHRQSGEDADPHPDEGDLVRAPGVLDHPADALGRADVLTDDRAGQGEPDRDPQTGD